MMKKNILLLLTIIGASILMQAGAQDTLPNFIVRNAGNHRIITSWKNRYEKVKQISIQRSPNGVTNFRTILTVPDPMNRENGYVDTKADHDSMYYRLFIVLDGAMFTFTPAKRPFIDTVKKAVAVAAVDTSNLAPDDPVRLRSLDPFNIDVNRPLTRNMDSSLNGNKDVKRPNIYVPSIFVYTARDGNVHLNLPDVSTKKYWIKFFDENNNPIFEIKNLKETSLIIDKTNFYHAGWFSFELYVDEKLKEKNKFYLAKEF
jgi:hypothetical protein